MQIVNRRLTWTFGRRWQRLFCPIGAAAYHQSIVVFCVILDYNLEAAITALGRSVDEWCCSCNILNVLLVSHNHCP